MPGILDAFASWLRWVSILIKDDFPTLDLPINAISGKFVSGHSDRFDALFIKFADNISIKNYRDK